VVAAGELAVLLVTTDAGCRTRSRRAADMVEIVSAWLK
jgi:hypothetical protein